MTKITKKTTSKIKSNKTSAKVKISAKATEKNNAKTSGKLENAFTVNSGIEIKEDGAIAVNQLTQDFRSAVLVVSLSINIVIFLTWVILQLTSQYDLALIQAFLSR